VSKHLKTFAAIWQSNFMTVESNDRNIGLYFMSFKNVLPVNFYYILQECQPTVDQKEQTCPVQWIVWAALTQTQWCECLCPLMTLWSFWNIRWPQLLHEVADWNSTP
jgi:hypothetical protein